MCLRERDRIYVYACTVYLVYILYNTSTKLPERLGETEIRHSCFSAASTATAPLFSKACGLQHSQMSGCLCNKQDRERFRRKIRLRSCGNLAALPNGNNLGLKDFTSYKSNFSLRKQIFWVITPRGCVNFFPDIWKEYTAFFSVLWMLELTHDRQEEDGNFSRNLETKSPIHQSQKSTIPDILTIPRWNHQITLSYW
jgi:hypothetical protein